MRWKRLALLLFVLVLTACTSKCPSENAGEPASSTGNAASTEALSPGLSYQVKHLPNPSFFDQDAATFRTLFPAPEDAILILSNTRVQIAGDDPRLTKMMNLLEYSMKEHKTTWIQGIIPEANAEAWYELNQPLLEIHFDAKKAEAEGFDAIDQILVCGAEYLMYCPPQFSAKVIEEHWPCIGYLQDLVSDGLLTKAEYDTAVNNAREVPWLNLLTFCGFTNQPEDGSSLNLFDK